MVLPHFKRWLSQWKKAYVESRNGFDRFCEQIRITAEVGVDCSNCSTAFCTHYLVVATFLWLAMIAGLLVFIVLCCYFHQCFGPLVGLGTYPTWYVLCVGLVLLQFRFVVLFGSRLQWLVVRCRLQ